MADRLKDFEDFLINTYDIMVAYCKSHGQSHEDSEEIVNDAYNRMWRVWDECADRESLGRKKWLYNTIDNIIRERKRKHELQTYDIDMYIDIIDNGDDDELKIAFENFKYDIYTNRAEKVLSKSEYEIFDQIVIKQRTYKEASDELGIREDTVRARMMRMREKIKQHMKEIFK